MCVCVCVCVDCVYIGVFDWRGCVGRLGMLCVRELEVVFLIKYANNCLEAE